MPEDSGRRIVGFHARSITTFLSHKIVPRELNTMTGASPAVGLFSVGSMIRDASGTNYESTQCLLSETMPAASQIIDPAEDKPTAHEVPITVFMSRQKGTTDKQELIITSSRREAECCNT